jgi:predicted RNase H-like nuclease (RuvC/YqgF family)
VTLSEDRLKEIETTIDAAESIHGVTYPLCKMLRELVAELRASQQRERELGDRRDALERLLACYRSGSQPSEKLHRDLERTRRALSDRGTP